MLESPGRIEPTRLEECPEPIASVIAELSAAAALLGGQLHLASAGSFAQPVRIMNTYYSNLIEGHDTRPRDIERALAGQLDSDEGRRNLQLEAAAYVRVQAEIDSMAARDALPEPASLDFIRWLHRAFYEGAPEALLRVESAGRSYVMRPGEWRSRPEHDVSVGRHVPPSSSRVAAFMQHFAASYRFDRLGSAGRIMAIAAAHHRFNYIHPFPDGNGRVSRLMSHAMATKAGIGAHGLWSVSRGLARGLKSPGEYLRMMDRADTPREGDLDGRGNLSQRALGEFILWFLKVCLDQVTFMTDLFELDGMASRLHRYVEQHDRLKPEAAKLLQAALDRGQFERGEAPQIADIPERTARRLLSDLTREGLLASATPKGPVSLRFPSAALEQLLPRLYPLA